MKPINEVYKFEEDEYFYASSYETLLESFEYDIVLQIDEADYQGDSYVLFNDKATDRYGYLCFGWGSCSGCDALQGCSNIKEVEELRNDMHEDILWGTCEELLHYFNTHDWEGDYSWYREEGRTFVAQAKAYLSDLCSSSKKSSNVTLDHAMAFRIYVWLGTELEQTDDPDYADNKANLREMCDALVLALHSVDATTEGK